jgi:hypothetical protein
VTQALADFSIKRACGYECARKRGLIRENKGLDGSNPLLSATQSSTLRILRNDAKSARLRRFRI